LANQPLGPGSAPFDADLFAVNPDTLAVETRPDGPSPTDLQIRHPTLSGLPKLPHRDALLWRYNEWRKRVDS
jgi:putative restriction endonuclease